jgi:Pvc16 N-terminal domain
MPHPAPEPRELSVIHSVLELIRMQLNGFIQNFDPRDDDWVILSNIVDQEGRSLEEAKGKIVMLLANITYAKIVETNNPTAQTQGGGSTPVRPPLYPDLFILFFANFTGEQYINGLHNVSRTIGFFQQHPVFTRDDFPPPPDPPGLPWPLDTLGLERLMMEITNLDLLEMHSLMGALGLKYLPSIYCKLRIIPRST